MDGSRMCTEAGELQRTGGISRPVVRVRQLGNSGDRFDAVGAGFANLSVGYEGAIMTTEKMASGAAREPRDAHDPRVAGVADSSVCEFVLL